MLFSVMTLNPQPLHIDFDFAAKSEWGKPLVNSLFTLGLMIGISVHDTTLGTTIANLGMTETVFPHPVFHGDTIRVETEVICVRESKSKPDRGIVEFEHRAFNQNGELVAKCRRQAMIMKKRRPEMRSLLFVPGDSERKLEKASSPAPTWSSSTSRIRSRRPTRSRRAHVASAASSPWTARNRGRRSMSASTISRPG